MQESDFDSLTSDYQDASPCGCSVSALLGPQVNIYPFKPFRKTLQYL